MYRFEKRENLIPNTVNPSPDYYCTWQVQLYATNDGKPDIQRHAINETSLFDTDKPYGWAYFYEKARRDLIFVMDSSRDISSEDQEIIEYIGERKAIVLINKIDLGKRWKKEDIQTQLPNASVLETSILERVGVDKIEEEILSMVYSGKVKQNESLMITNVRHKELLEKALASMKDAFNMTVTREAMDFIEVDLNSAYESLGEIIGETVTDDIINEVFSRFCLGK